MFTRSSCQVRCDQKFASILVCPYDDLEHNQAEQLQLLYASIYRDLQRFSALMRTAQAAFKNHVFKVWLRFS